MSLLLLNINSYGAGIMDMWNNSSKYFFKIFLKNLYIYFNLKIKKN